MSTAITSSVRPSTCTRQGYECSCLRSSRSWCRYPRILDDPALPTTRTPRSDFRPFRRATSTVSTQQSNGFAPATDREHPAVADPALLEPTVSTQVVDASAMLPGCLACHASHLRRRTPRRRSAGCRTAARSPGEMDPRAVEPAALVLAVCLHAGWGARREVDVDAAVVVRGDAGREAVEAGVRSAVGQHRARPQVVDHDRPEVLGRNRPGQAQAVGALRVDPLAICVTVGPTESVRPALVPVCDPLQKEDLPLVGSSAKLGFPRAESRGPQRIAR